MALSNWWEVTTPHKDIREGRMGESIFAADLGDVFDKNAPIEYRDAGSFFQKTYLTQGLQKLLDNVLSRLSGKKGDPVIQLQTPFGGGKTHTLLALYHVVKNRDRVDHFDVISGLPKPKNAKVVVFVGTNLDPIKGRTPWGEIAYQLGTYEKVKEHDEKKRSPGKEVLERVLGESPVLILIDELVEYVVKAKDFADQIYAFSQEITEVVRSKGNCCLVCTLPSSAPYGISGEEALSQLQRIYGRVESVYTPVQGVEIYEIIRKRLFDDLGDEKIRKEVAQSYFDMYQKLGTEVPPEVNELEYRDRMEHAYPFHPEIIDVLYEHWGSYPSFQRTRGVLRLLADVVTDIYKRKIPSVLIQSSLVNLDNPTIRREFVKHIGNEYDSVIAADIAGKNAKAPKIDKEMGSEYEKYGIASGIATSVFLYSFSGAEKKETTLPRIRVAVLREGIQSPIVGDAIGKLEEELWYFHSDRKQYAFRNQPNLNRVIIDKEETITQDKVRERLREQIQKNAGKALEVYLWPEGGADIPDNKNLKIAILAPEFCYGFNEGEKLTSELFEKAGSGFRVYKNTLFVLAMEQSQLSMLFKSIKRALALEAIQSDRQLLVRLKESQDELKRKAKDTEKEIPFLILNAYRHLALSSEKGVEWKDMGIPTAGMVLPISDRVRQYLKGEEKILSNLTPKYIIDKSFARDENEKPLREIYELFLRTPGMSLLENEDVLLRAVKEGVRTGLIGAKENLEVYYRQDFRPTMDSIVLRGGFAEKLKMELASGKKEASESVEAGRTVNYNLQEAGQEKKVVKEPDIKSDGKTVKVLTLRAKIAWDKLSDITRGVIQPLINEGAEPEITIEINAKTKDNFSRTTLNNKVKETLQQVGAKIERWNEE